MIDEGDTREMVTTALAAGYRHVDTATFAHLLRNMGDAKLITQDSSGLLLHGDVGERIVNHYSFYASFQTAEE